MNDEDVTHLTTPARVLASRDRVALPAAWSRGAAGYVAHQGDQERREQYGAPIGADQEQGHQEQGQGEPAASFDQRIDFEVLDGLDTFNPRNLTVPEFLILVLVVVGFFTCVLAVGRFIF